MVQQLELAGKLPSGRPGRQTTPSTIAASPAINQLSAEAATPRVSQNLLGPGAVVVGRRRRLCRGGGLHDASSLTHHLLPFQS